MNEVDIWLRDLNATALEMDGDTIENIDKCRNEIKELLKQEKKLAAIKAKCDNMSEHQDVRPLADTLSKQLAATITVIQQKLVERKNLESNLLKLRDTVATPSDNTLNSSPIPEIVESHFGQCIEVETQTSESLQIPKANKKVDMVESSVQTKDIKSTENIVVSQTQSEGHETIKFESTPNLNVEEYVEDVLVDAKYKQPNEPNKSTQLILQNVPQTSFETIFVEPDSTTTEVVIDADGRKQIIVRKVKQNIEHKKSIDQKQHLEIVATDAESNPAVQKILDPNMEIDSTSLLVMDESKANFIPVAIKDSEDTHHENTSVQTVVHHVTQRIVRRKKKIIRKLTIIDGKEHISEEVIEEPEEIEITENQIPGVNINLGQMIEVHAKSPIVELAPEMQSEQHEIEIVNEPVIIFENKTSDKNDKGKEEPASKKVIEENHSQVLDFEKHAPVDLVDSAQVVADLSITTVSDINDILAAKIEEESNVELRNDDLNNVVDISEIWPKTQQLQTSTSSSVDKSFEVKQSDEAFIDLPKSDSIKSENIWPLDEKTGHVVEMVTYTFEQEQIPSARIEQIDIEKISSTISEPAYDPKDTTSVTNIFTTPNENQNEVSTSTEQDHDPVLKHRLEENLSQPQKPLEVEEHLIVAEIQTDDPINTKQLQSDKQDPILMDLPEPSRSETSITFSIADSKRNKKKKKHNAKEKTNTLQSTEVTKNQVHENVSVPEPESEVNENQPIDIKPQILEITAQVCGEQSSQEDIEPKIDTKSEPEQECSESKLEIASNSTKSVEGEDNQKIQLEIDEVILPQHAESEVHKETNIISIENPIQITQDISIQQINEPEIVIEKCETESSKTAFPKDQEPPQKTERKTLDVRSATKLFIENELMTSDGTTRTVKLTMSPNEPSPPGSVTVKMKLDSSEQPRLNVNLIEERIQSIEPSELSVAKSTDLHLDDDDTISEQMEMPEMEATPTKKEVDDELMMSTEQLLDPSPIESYKSISELGSPVKIVEECIISPSSDSPKPLGAEVIVAAQVYEEKQTEDVQQQTELPVKNANDESSNQFHTEKPISSSRSMQTTPEHDKIYIDEIVQTSLGEMNIDKEIQTSPIQMPEENVEITDPIVKTNQEVCYFEISYDCWKQLDTIKPILNINIQIFNFL